ncbi:hypothetical protein NW756_008576 [Fusarium oxysporum]|nr:hypothetical protein NW763_013353 [Fusarium oxysporum]KAJ4039996.1 hypothetical protein NW753_011027 [Fusarium oxysporum]KAJ4085194.1 hypothetical protein NW756_008576 [Fusarium oxysporum]
MAAPTSDSVPERSHLLFEQNPTEDEPSPDNTAKGTSTSNTDKRTKPPFWLSKYALLMFCVIFITLAASLIVLKYVSDAQDGFPLNFSSSEYTWTYGPTAILVIVLSLWRRVDYYFKSAEPWRELQSGPVVASKSLLLDYVSPFQPFSAFHAFRIGHYRVVATILSFFILKGIILISTTLFSVQSSLHHQLFNITYRDVFDAEKAWTSPAFYSTLQFEDCVFFSGGSDQGIWNYLAHLNNAVANDSTWKTVDGRVTQRFTPPQSVFNLTALEAPVDVFVPHVACEEATLSIDFDVRRSRVEYSWTSDTCSTGRHDAYLCPDHRASVYNITTCGETPRAYSLHRANCSASLTHDGGAEYRRSDDLEDHDIRYAITAAQYTVDMDVAEHKVSQAISLVNHSAVICKIGYNIVSGSATLDALSGDVSLNPVEMNGGRQLKNLTNSSLAEMLITNLDTSSTALVVDKDVPIMTVESGVTDMGCGAGDAFAQLMAVKLGEHFKPSILWQPFVLRNISIDILEGLLDEFARESLLVNKLTNGTAKGSVSESRLHMRTLAVCTMAAGFSVLAAICLLMLIFSPESLWIPSMGGSIAGHAAILINSPPLHNLLRSEGQSSEKELADSLKDTTFKTAVNSPGNLGVETTEESPSLSDKSDQKSLKDRKSWTPISGRRWFVVATLAFPLLAIGGLELLQQLSNKRQGLVDMHRTDSTSISYTIRIASTATVFAIATLVNSLDFTITAFAPYSSLRGGNSPPERSILFHLLSVPPFLIFFKSLRACHFGPAASNISSLLSSFLTIIVSGLWTLTGPVTLEGPFSVMVGNWRSTWPVGAVDDGGAAMILNLVRYGGANTSSSIWQDLVLPHVSLTSSTPISDDIYRSANYTYAIGGLRPLLDCSVAPQENLTMTMWRDVGCRLVANDEEQDCSFKRTRVTLRRPEGCEGHDTDGTFSFGTATEGRGAFEAPRWVGRFLDLNTILAGSNASCPTIGVLFGQMGSNDTSDWNMTALVCTQGLEQVPVTVTYKGNPSLREINEQHPPKLELEKAWRWVNGTSKSKAFGYQPGRFLDADLTPFPIDEPDTRTFDEDDDPFFDHLLHGPNRIERESLLGPSNTEKLIRAVQKDYSEYMRHVIDLNFRANSSNTHGDLISAEALPNARPSSVATEITGTTSAQVTRLAIHTTSKLLLQILLGLMALLSLASYLLVKIDGTLPRNPCSIASTMAFLAGSQLCDRDAGIIPQGAEYMTDGQLKQAFDGWVFSLGWWQKEEASVESEEPNDYASTLGDRDVPDEAQEGQRTPGRFGVDIGRASVSKF